jgi:hypothetical protein
MTFEELLQLAADVAADRGRDGNDALELANAILDFDACIRSGEQRLPASWRECAAHAAGYEAAK